MDVSKLSITFHFLQRQLLKDIIKLDQNIDISYFIPFLTIISNGKQRFDLANFNAKSIKGDDLIEFNNCCHIYERVRVLSKNDKIKLKQRISDVEMADFSEEDIKITKTYNSMLKLMNEGEYMSFEEDIDILFPSLNIAVTTMISFFRFRIFSSEEAILNMCLKLNNEKLPTMVMVNCIEDYDTILDKLVQPNCVKTIYGDINREKVFRSMIALNPNKVKYFKDIDINSISLELFINIICTIDDIYFMELLNNFLNRANDDTIKILKIISNPYVSQIAEKFDNILVSHIVSDTYSIDVLKTMTTILSAVGLRFRGENSKTWVVYLTRTTAHDEKYFMMHLALLISWAFIFMPPNSTSEVNQPAVKEFVSFLKETTENVERITCNSLSQYMILVTILFHRDDYVTLKETTEKVLEFKCTVKTLKLDVMKDIYLNHGLSINNVLDRVDKLEVTENLSSETEGFLPIHCINYLLNLGRLSDNQMNIIEWIQKQILSSKLPVSPQLIQLIIEYTNVIFNSESKDCNSKLLSIPFMENAFKGKVIDESKLLLRVMCFLYLLSYKKNLLKASSCAGEAEKKCIYPDWLINQIPKSYLVTIVDLRRDDFGALYGKIISMMNILYTYELPNSEIKLSDILVDDESCDMIIGVKDKAIELNRDHIKTLKCLNVIELSSYATSIVNALTKSLTDLELYDKESIGLLANYWFTISRLFPERIIGQTVEAWCAEDSFTEKDISENPLRIFRCHETVLNSAKHFTVLIELVEYFLQKYSTHISMNINRIKMLPSNEIKDIEEKQRMRDITLDTVQVTIIQIFLDCCLENDKNKNDLEEIRKMVCQFMHKKFLQTCNLITFVHFQTYHRSLIEMVVKNVPSVHIMRTKTNEMFAVAEMKKKIFAILLLIELAVQYDLPASLVHCHFVLDFIMSMRRHLATIDYINTLRIVLPSIPKILTTYPQDALKLHVEQVFSLGREISKIHAATHSSLYSMQQSPGYKLMKMIDELMYKHNLKVYDFANTTKKTVFGPN
uniref:Fanconi anemia group D2 protein n=1 Tax=Parastrongyloides trichosuri TaxID=131310 RepID=A0A0N4Z6V9_PARTI